MQHWGGCPALVTAPAQLPQIHPCSSSSSSNPPRGHSGRSLLDRWMLGSRVSVQRISMMQSSLEKAPWWWASPQLKNVRGRGEVTQINTWSEGVTEGGMCNEKRAKPTKRGYYVLSVADWCDPTELPLIRKGEFSLDEVGNDQQYSSIPSIVVFWPVPSELGLQKRDHTTNVGLKCGVIRNRVCSCSLHTQCWWGL